MWKNEPPCTTKLVNLDKRAVLVDSVRKASNEWSAIAACLWATCIYGSRSTGLQGDWKQGAAPMRAANLPWICIFPLGLVWAIPFPAFLPFLIPVHLVHHLPHELALLVPHLRNCYCTVFHKDPPRQPCRIHSEAMGFATPFSSNRPLEARAIEVLWDETSHNPKFTIINIHIWE